MMWCIRDKKQWLFYTASATKAEAIKAYCSYGADCWAYHKRHGVRCVRLVPTRRQKKGPTDAR